VTIQEVLDSYKLSALVPNTFGTKSAADLAYNEQKTLTDLQVAEFGLSFVLHAPPYLGTVAYALERDKESFIVSGLGDAAILFTAGSSRAAVVAGLSIQAGVIGYRGYGIYKAVGAKDWKTAAILSGEVTLRLIGLGFGVRKLVTVIKNTKFTRIPSGNAPQKLPTKAPLDKFKYPQAPGSKPFSPTIEPGDYVFVQDENGVVHVLKETEGHLHPKILGNAQPAAAAGGLKVGPEGKILEIDNASGTFKFKPDTLEQVKQALKNQGANVDDTVLKPFKN
jgi:hypothetical protein